MFTFMVLVLLLLKILIPFFLSILNYKTHRNGSLLETSWYELLAVFSYCFTDSSEMPKAGVANGSFNAETISTKDDEMGSWHTNS